MTKYLVFGHKNPDTDAVSAAIAMAYYLEKLGHEAESVALGEISDETQFALDSFSVEAPRIISAIDGQVERVALVDHNEPQQSVDDLASVEVDYVVDHHRISGFETAQPLYYRAEPIGCTSTVLYKMFQEKEIDIPQAIAGLMLSAIISDTLLFKSPTSTQEDQDAAIELAKIADVDYQQYGLDLLKSGTNLSDKSDLDLLNGDAKSFDMNGKNVRIGQVNVVDFDQILGRKEDLLAEMKKEIDAHGYDLFLLVTTDILNSTSIAFVAGDASQNVEKAFNSKLTDQEIELTGVVSRKKQVVPALTQSFEA